ncbi:MAG: glycosyltransferase [Thermodesulfobacteriota bacterium]
MSRDYKVSVVIATYNRSVSVERVLDSLSDQTFPAEDFEVVVSIDGSRDGTREMVDKYESDYDLRAVWHANSGRASACNRGIRDSRGEIVIILDDDMEPSRDLIRAHYAAHQRGAKLGVIGAVPIAVDSASTPVIRYVGEKFNSHLRKLSIPGYRIRIRDFYSGNFSIRREDMLEHGMYNEEFTIYGNEDVELAYRLLKAGIVLVYDPDALCVQNYEKGFKGLAYDTISKGKTAVLVAGLYPDAFKELKLTEYNLTGWKWRALRMFLIRSSMLVPATTDAVIMMIGLSERFGRRVQERLYSLGLDYLFWLGVWSAIRKDKSGGGLDCRIKSWGRS